MHVTADIGPRPEDDDFEDLEFDDFSSRIEVPWPFGEEIDEDD
jgi:hypothetical protein